MDDINAMRAAIDLLGGMETTEDRNPELSLFIQESLFLVAKSHMWHLLSKSYAQHKALNEFYDELQDLIDELAEASIGVNGELSLCDRTFTYSDCAGCIEEIKHYKEYIDNVSQQMQDQNSLINVLDDINTLCDQTIYKLENLH